MMTKYLVVLVVLSGFMITPVFGQDSCDINNDVEVRKKLDQDPVVQEFMERHPSALFQHYKTYDEPKPPHTFSEFTSDRLRLKVIVSEYDDEGNCYLINGYSTEYDLPNTGTGISTKIMKFGADQWKDAVHAVQDLTNPHKQMKMGIPIYAIKCKEGLHPIPKRDRITPACVSDEAESRLVLRGWTPLRIGMPAETNVLISYDAAMLYPFKATKDLDPRSPYFSMVYWVNNDVVSHTIIAEDGSWKTKVIKPGKSEFMSFNKTGIYNYFVAEKPDTKGIVAFERFIHFDPDETEFFPKQVAIEEIKEKIMSSQSVDEVREEIQRQVDENDLQPFSAVLIRDMKEEYNTGEKISFDLVNFGYRNWCLMPKISVYHEDYIFPIYENDVVHTCPPPWENPSPRISIYGEQEFRTFPTCQYEGTYTVWAEAFEFDPQAVGSFYCKSDAKFVPPRTYDVTIPQGAGSVEGKNFSPSETVMKYGDYIRIVNQDTKMHKVVLFVDKSSGSVIMDNKINPNDEFTMPVYDIGEFELAVLDENEKEYPHMHGIVRVTEN